MSDYKLLDHTEQWITRPRFKAARMLSLYPSEASVVFVDSNGIQRTEGTCMKAAYLRATGKEKAAPPDARGEKIMSVGKTIEGWFIDRWKEMGIWVDNNVKFYWPEYNVSGELDAILVEPGTTEPYGVEVKTFYGYDAAKEIFGNKKMQGFPKINQLLQTIVYVYFFKERLKFFKMVYMDRSDCRTREFKIEVKEGPDGKWYPMIDGSLFTTWSVQDVLERYKLLNYHVVNELTPPRDYELVFSPTKVEQEKKLGNIGKTAYEEWKKGKRKIGDWQCRYCAFQSPCWGIGENAIEEEQAEEEPTTTI